MYLFDPVMYWSECFFFNLGSPLKQIPIDYVDLAVKHWTLNLES